MNNSAPYALQRLDFLQAARAIAALMVVFHHALFELAQWANAQALREAQPLLENLRAMPFNMGVDIFFVISGFVMVYVSANQFGARGAAQSFLKRRIFRLVPLYWLMSGLFLLTSLGLGTYVNSRFPEVIEIIKSLFFIPYKNADGAMQPVYSLGWTLNYEMFFYAIFALLLRFQRGVALVALVVIFTALVLIGRIYQPQNEILAFYTQPIILEFVAGAVIAHVYLSGIRIRGAFKWALIIAAIGAIWLLFKGILPDHWYVVLCASALFIGMLALIPQDENSARFNAMLRPIGDASYALYLIHPFILRSTRMVMMQIFPQFSWLSASVYVLIVLALCCAASLLVYRVFEVPVTRVLQKRFG